MNRPARYLFASFFVLIIASLIFNAKAGPEWLRIYHIVGLELLFGGIGFAVYGYHVYGFDGRFGISVFTYLLCMLVLIGVVLQQIGEGFSAPGRAAKLALIALLLLFFLGVCPRQYSYLKRTWVYLLAFAVLFSIHLYHVAPLAPSSGSAGLPIAAGFMMGLNMFIIPRYVSRDSFLWAISLLAGAVVLIGIPAYFIGSYEFLGMDVELWGGTFTPLLMDGELNALQSVFANPNSLGVVGFAGTVAAAMLSIGQFPSRNDGGGRENRRVRADGASATVLSFPFMLSLGLSFFAGVLFVVNALGTYLSNSRASFLALGVSLLLYFVYVAFGRRSLPYAVIGLIGAVLLFLFLLPTIGISATGRFDLWSGAIEAVLAEPTLLGRGIVDPGEVIAPYVEGPASGHSPHNSYLTILLRTGWLGAGAYLLIIIGSLLSGAIRYKRVDVPALVLALGFAVHQIFEAYSLFQYEIMAVIASLAFGYLILNGSLIDQDEESTGDRTSMNDRKTRRESSDKSRTDAWSRPEWNR